MLRDFPMGDSPTIRLIIVSPALAVRAGLRFLLGSDAPAEAPALEVIAEAASLAELDPVPTEADILLLADEVVSARDLEGALSGLPKEFGLLLLTENQAAARQLAALNFSAWGVLTPDMSAEELLAAIRALNEGLLVGAPALMRFAFSRPLSIEAEDSNLPGESLTERETEVLQLLSQGLANKQIATSLGISEHTVKFHVSSIYTKLGATNRAEAVRLGVQGGLVVL
jgi:DNA-binding NarL/FixJ family response regulator